MEPEYSFMPLTDHLNALRLVLIRCFFAIALGFLLAFSFQSEIIPFLSHVSDTTQLISIPTQTAPLSLEPVETVIFEKTKNNQLLILSPQEGLSQVIKICFWIGFASTTPIWGYFLYRFISPGLHPNEKLFVSLFIIGSLFFICSGILVAYFFTIPAANRYLFKFNQSIGQNAWTLTNYIDYSLILYAGHAVAFTLAFLLFLLAGSGTISYEYLKKSRKFFYLTAFVLGALLTPPDVLTQLFLAIPLILFFELALIISRLKQNFIVLPKEPSRK